MCDTFAPNVEDIPNCTCAQHAACVVLIGIVRPLHKIGVAVDSQLWNKRAGASTRWCSKTTLIGYPIGSILAEVPDGLN